MAKSNVDELLIAHMSDIRDLKREIDASNDMIIIATFDAVENIDIGERFKLFNELLFELSMKTAQLGVVKAGQYTIRADEASKFNVSWNDTDGRSYMSYYEYDGGGKFVRAAFNYPSDNTPVINVYGMNPVEGGDINV